jgi:hypothetical protein
LTPPESNVKAEVEEEDESSEEKEEEEVEEVKVSKKEKKEKKVKAMVVEEEEEEDSDEDGSSEEEGASYKPRSRDNLNRILGLDANDDKRNKYSFLDKVTQQTLKELKSTYEHSIKPLETLYKYRDLSNRHFGGSLPPFP